MGFADFVLVFILQHDLNSVHLPHLGWFDLRFLLLLPPGVYSHYFLYKLLSDKATLKEAQISDLLDFFVPFLSKNAVRSFVSLVVHNVLPMLFCRVKLKVNQ